MSLATIAVFSDVVCPWCYVGKRRLNRALESLGLRGGVSVRWLPFELNPEMPPEGMDRAVYRARKFGPARSAAADAELTSLGAADGLGFDFHRIKRTPNTRKAHMLTAYADRHGLADAVVEALFRAYFEGGLDVGDEEILVKVAAEAGLDPSGARTAVDDESLRREVAAIEQRAAELGVAGVPFFIVDDTRALSGAQPISTWVEVLRHRAASRPVLADEAG